MSAIKRMMENIYYDSIDQLGTNKELAEKYNVDEDFVEDAILIMTEALEGDQ